MNSFMYYEYGPVESFIDEDHIVGGIDPEIKKRRIVIRFMSMIHKLGISSASDFLFYPVFPSPDGNYFHDPLGNTHSTVY